MDVQRQYDTSLHAGNEFHNLSDFNSRNSDLKVFKTDLENKQQRLEQQRAGDIERAEAIIRLHDAKAELYGDDTELDEWSDQLAAALADQTVITNEVQIEKPKTIISFDKAKRILAEKSDKFKNQVSVEEFEEAYRFFVELGSSDLDKSYEKEQIVLAKLKRPLTGLTNKVDAIKEGLAKDGDDAKVLRIKLSTHNVSIKDLDRVTKALGDNLAELGNEIPVSDNLAKIYFFLQENYPDTPDQTLITTVLIPFLDYLTERAHDKDDLKLPKRPKPAANKSQQKRVAQQTKAFPKKLQEFKKKLEASIPEAYMFIKSLLEGQEPQLINKRLVELNNDS